MADLTGATWRKSTRSGNGGNCIEVATNLSDMVGVRDSKDTTGPVLTFIPGQWTAFTSGLRTGSFPQ